MAEKDKYADEIMSDEELDNVAGGKAVQASYDSCFLNSLNGSCDRYGTTRLVFENHKEEIENAWSTVGITAKIRCGFSIYSNEYYLNGQEITQEQARQHAMKVTGHYMSESDWNW